VNKPYLNLFFSTLSLVAIIGCGAKKSGVSFSSVRAPTTSNINHSLGECNRINFLDVNLFGQVGTYYDPLTRLFREDLINMNLTTLPTELFTSSTVQVQIFRWLSRATGQRQTNQIPVTFYFVDKLTGATTAQTPVNQISKTTIDSARKTLGTTWLNVTTQQFFDRVMIVLTGMSLQYDAITLAYYNSAVGTAAVYQADVLLPAFYADPNIYKIARTAHELLLLHPNYSYINSNATDADYMNLINAICAQLAGSGVRIPASADSQDFSFTAMVQSVWNQITHSLEVLYKNLMN
jgi:hypothetical protein